MSYAWQTTPEDVQTVLDRMKLKLDPDETLKLLNCGAIEKAALDGGTEMDDQTNAAYDEIERQIRELQGDTE